jgi:pyrroline-5-carboxylate reductase
MSESPLADVTLGFIGAGNMAEAIARGVLNAELLPAGQIVAADPEPARREVFAGMGARAVAENAEAAAAAEILILAVKPQIIDEVADGLAGSLASKPLVVSIAAGVGLARLAKHLPAGARLMRAMPNTPMTLGYGVTGLARGAGATEEDVGRVHTIFSAAGVAIEVEDEALLHAVTAVSGSGPAYAFRFVEALAAAGEEAGLPAEVALAMAAGTVAGAGLMLMQSGEAPADLRERVTSPGGTTEAALKVLQQEQFADIIAKAVRAAQARSVELGGED